MKYWGYKRFLLCALVSSWLNIVPSAEVCDARNGEEHSCYWSPKKTHQQKKPEFSFLEYTSFTGTILRKKIVFGTLLL
jgi:hypothetical protein